MPFRVPLILEKSLAVVHRLNPTATESLSPDPSVPAGYDKDFRTSVKYDTTGVDGKPVRQTTRIEFPPVKIPCQVEIAKWEDLRQIFSGDMPTSDIQLVFHRVDLERLQLIDPQTREMHLKKGDRVQHLESHRRPGKITMPFDHSQGLYIFEIQPRSQGFGDDGFDLHMAWLSERERGR
jgi:hypothetical protein